MSLQVWKGKPNYEQFFFVFIPLYNGKKVVKFRKTTTTTNQKQPNQNPAKLREKQNQQTITKPADLCKQEYSAVSSCS